MPRVFGYNREVMSNLPDIKLGKFAEGVLNGGMNLSIDPSDLETSELQLARNCYVRFDKTSRRYGSDLFTPLKPNSSPVLKFASIKQADGIGYTIRFTPTTLHYINVAAWTEIPVAVGGAGLTGTQADRFNAVIMMNDLVFSNNGADPIQKVDFPTLTYDQLGNAPAFRYICGFYNRVVGAALRDSNEVLIGWSADGVIEEWDDLVDETAGEGPLVDSPADLSDYITGLFAWTNIMIVLREKSVWVATKQPIPTNPFNFHAVIPGFGCDCPYSAANIGDGLAWFDRRTRSVYAYSPGGSLEPIGKKVSAEIARNIDDPNQVFSGYDPVHGEYSINIRPASSDFVMSWIYNRNTKAWVYNEMYDLTSMDDIEIATGGLTIDDLGITNIDNLAGTIDELSPTNLVIAARVLGFGDGSAAKPDETKTDDAPHTDFPIGVPYTTELISKIFTIPDNDVYIAEIRIEVKAELGGAFRLEYSRTGGEGLNSWRLAKIIDPQVLGRGALIKYRRMIRCRKFAWRLISETGLFDVISYEVHVYEAGKSHR